MAMREDLVVNCFEVLERVVIPCDDVVNGVSSALAA